jgi:bacillithiol system protein YtxJ
MVLNRFTMAYSHEEEKADIYFLDIHRSRPVSDEIAQRYEVRHESPQLLVIKNGVVVAHRSHGAIPALDLSLFLKKNPGS